MGTGNRKDEKKSIVFKEGEVRQMKDFEKRHGLPEIELFDIEMEEERDANAIRLFLKKYSKLWRFFYHKYANMCYSHKSINNFDDLRDKNETVNLAELRKLLDDHGYDKKTWLSKDELRELVKLVNLKVMNRYDAEAMNFDGFKEWVLQFAIYVYSKPPHDYSAFPPLKSLELMLDKMKVETEKRKQPTILYEDPDATGIKDPDLVIALNNKLSEDPNYPVPEGFTKQKEKTLVYSYGFPEYLNLSEAQQTAYEFLDEFINEKFGFHFLEPLCTFEDKHKIRPIIRKQFKDGKRVETPSYLLSLDKRQKPKELNDKAQMDALDRRRTMNDRAPRLPTSLKLEVAKFPTAQRAYAQEVAETLEEVLRAAENGLTEMPP